MEKPENYSSEKGSNKFMQWNKLKWLILTIGPVIFTFRAVQFVLMGFAGTINLTGVEWVILISELVSSLSASIGCIILYAKEPLSNRKKLKELIVISFCVISYTLHFIRLISYLSTL
jgi:hypothetical protein